MAKRAGDFKYAFPEGYYPIFMVASGSHHLLLDVASLEGVE